MKNLFCNLAIRIFREEGRQSCTSQSMGTYFQSVAEKHLFRQNGLIVQPILLAQCKLALCVSKTRHRVQVRPTEFKPLCVTVSQVD